MTHQRGVSFAPRSSGGTPLYSQMPFSPPFIYVLKFSRTSAGRTVAEVKGRGFNDRSSLPSFTEVWSGWKRRKTGRREATEWILNESMWWRGWRHKVKCCCQPRPCQKRERAVFHAVMFVFIDYISAQQVAHGVINMQFSIYHMRWQVMDASVSPASIRQQRCHAAVTEDESWGHAQISCWRPKWGDGWLEI